MFDTVRYVLKDLKKSSALLCEKEHRRRLPVLADMVCCALFHYTLPEEYYTYGYDLMPRSYRKECVTEHNIRKLTPYLNKSGSSCLMFNKYYTYCLFSDLFRREVRQNLDFSYEDFLAFVQKEPKFIFKPFDGFGGHGHQVVDMADEPDTRAVYDRIMASPRGVLEGWVRQHDKMNEIYPGAVHICRIHTLHDGSGKNIRTFDSSASFGFGGNIVNNHLGTTLACAVDDETGVVLTDGVDPQYTHYETIPGSEVAIRGFQIPDWDKALEVAKTAAARVPELQLIGWDIAFSQDGPVIIEGNLYPGFSGTQTRAWGREGLSHGSYPLLCSYANKNRNK